MDKKKTKNKNHNKKKHSASNQLAKFRGWIQAGATLLTNIHLPNFFKGEIYQGKGKAVCVPGLNCYSCPAASGACPIGSFQAVVGSSKYKFSYYITGFLILLGVLLGRFICGFLCPFGWLPYEEKAMCAHAKEMMFPIGAPNDGFAQYFSGRSFLAPISTSQVGIFNVTLEPGCSKLDYVA